MTCLKAQSLITPFIKDELNIKELEEFLDHINSCPDCREELGVYYALLTAMKQLDEDKNLSDDYGYELNLKLQSAEEKIIHTKYTYYRKKGILLFIILLAVFFVNLGYLQIQKEKQKFVTESSFKLRIMYKEDRFNSMEMELNRYLGEQNLSINSTP